MMRGIYLSSFVVIGWAFLTLSWGQGKLCPALVAYWPWPKVTEIGAKKIFQTHRSTMCGLKKLASEVFPESWKSVGRMAAAAAETAAAETDQKQLEQLECLRSEIPPPPHGYPY